MNTDNTGLNSGKEMTLLAIQNGTKQLKNSNIWEMMVSTLNGENGGKNSKVSQLMEKDGLRCIKSKMIIGRESLKDIPSTQDN